jgi:hypothetical protein
MMAVRRERGSLHTLVGSAAVAFEAFVAACKNDQAGWLRLALVLQVCCSSGFKGLLLPAWHDVGGFALHSCSIQRKWAHEKLLVLVLSQHAPIVTQLQYLSPSP